MEKLPTCRICLVEDVRMYVIVNKDMHKLYEKLTDKPFVTEDHRPMLACSFCCTKLKQCCRFQRQCMEAEELFALMLNENHEQNLSINPEYLQFFNGFVKTPVHQISIVDENQSDDVKAELPDVSERLDEIIEPKKEYQSDSNNELIPENLYNSYSYVEYKPKLHFESDSEDDVIFVGLQTKVEEDLEVSRMKRRANTTRAPVAKKSKLQIRRIKSEDVVIKEEQKTYEQSDSQEMETKHKVKNSSSDNNTDLDTNTCNNSGNDDRCKISNKCIDTDDVIKCQRLKVKEKRFKCNICQRGFNQKGHLTTHIRIHTGEKRYECGICQIAFTRVDILYKHMQRHTGEKPFKCDICKRRFSQKANLKRHILIHTGEKPYKCDLCQYSSNQKADLKKHIRIHTDEKPYKCDICQHRCNRKSVLTLHIIRKHNPGKKPLKSKM